MPTVKPVAKKPNPTGNVQPETPPNRPTGTIDTAPPANRPTGQIAIPDFLSQSMMPETVEQTLTGYIGFGEPASKKNWPQISAAGVKEGQPYAARQGEIIPLPQLEFFLLRADSFKTCMNNTGDFTFCTRDLELPDDVSLQVSRGRLQEHYIGLLIVRLPNGKFIPIKGDFRGTKSNALSGPINAVKAATTPEWANQSDANRIAAQFQKPFGRVYHIVTTSYYVGKASGNASYIAKSRSTPSTVAQIEALMNLFTDDEFVADLKEANTNYEGRLQFFDELLTKNRG